MSRPTIATDALAGVLTAYPALGDLRRIVRNGLSANTATCLFETSRGIYFAKAYDPRQRDAASLSDEHALVRRLVETGYPTPALMSNQDEATVTWHGGLGYVLSDVARGTDRYGDIGVFEPFGSPPEARAAGAMLARFHLCLAEAPALAPRPFRGLTARYELMRAPSLARGLADLIAGAPALRDFLSERPDWKPLEGFLEARHAALFEPLAALPRGLIHGDFIKRNLFWQGDEISDVIDFDLWNVGYWVYDLALALLPCGFDWPALLKGQGRPRYQDMQALLEGYCSVRELSSSERPVLPAILETARIEFYLGAIATMLLRSDAAQAAHFHALLMGTTRWFQAHPTWHEELPLP